jgi:hypothetical protein
MRTQILIYLPNTDQQMNELALQTEAFDRAQPHESLDLEATLMDGLNPNESFDADKLAALCQK